MTKQHHIHLVPGDVAETVLLPSDVNRASMIADMFDDKQLVAKYRQYITYTGRYKGNPVSVTTTGIGGPALSIAVEELVNIGAKNFIRVGTCGALQQNIKLGDVVIATGAVRGDGTSREYFPLEYPAVADFFILESLIESAKQVDVDHHVGIIRSHDAIYAESILAEKDNSQHIHPWIKANVLAEDNESSTLFTLASARKCRAGAILTPVRHQQFPDKFLTDQDKLRSIDLATSIALDAVVRLSKN